MILAKKKPSEEDVETKEEKEEETKTPTKAEEKIKEPTVEPKPTEPSLDMLVKTEVGKMWKGEVSALRSRLLLQELTIERLHKILDKHGIKE